MDNFIHNTQSTPRIPPRRQLVREHSPPQLTGRQISESPGIQAPKTERCIEQNLGQFQCSSMLFEPLALQSPLPSTGNRSGILYHSQLPPYPGEHFIISPHGQEDEDCAAAINFDTSEVGGMASGTYVGMLQSPPYSDTSTLVYQHTLSSDSTMFNQLPIDPYPPMSHSSQSHSSWLSSSSEYEPFAASKAVRAYSYLPEETASAKADGPKKSNARLDIPPGRTVNNIDGLIAEAENPECIKELKTQKRLLRNREAALLSRQRKKVYTEKLEEENRLLRNKILQLNQDILKLKDNNQSRGSDGKRRQYSEGASNEQRSKPKIVNETPTTKDAEQIGVLKKRIAQLTQLISSRSAATSADAGPCSEMEASMKLERLPSKTERCIHCANLGFFQCCCSTAGLISSGSRQVSAPNMHHDKVNGPSANIQEYEDMQAVRNAEVQGLFLRVGILYAANSADRSGVVTFPVLPPSVGCAAVMLARGWAAPAHNLHPILSDSRIQPHDLENHSSNEQSGMRTIIRQLTMRVEEEALELSRKLDAWSSDCGSQAVQL